MPKTNSEDRPLESETQPIYLLRTKLNRPTLTSDHVQRAALKERLDAASNQPVILVSAPAGYGKSTLVSYWLDTIEKPSAWLSLDEDDNDLQRFLSYFVAAIQTVAPSAMSETQSLVDASTLPPVLVLATSLANELDQLDQNLIVVLDDIHLIRNMAVQEVLKRLLQHPPRALQLVLVGRQDPMISIATLRAQGILTELRMNDLRFTINESTAFLQTAMANKIDPSTAGAIANKAEGWVAGLRLIALAEQGQKDPGRKLLSLKGTTQYVVEYLIREVLNHQSASMRDALLRTAILDRFCVPLCDALFEVGVTPLHSEIDGHTFIDKLQKDNLFVLSMDIDNHWFSYHHMFRELLNRLLNEWRTPEEIRALHLRASHWFASQKMTDKALKHAIEADDFDLAADIVEAHRLEILNADRWPILIQLLSQLPEEVVWQRPELLLSECWLAYYRFRIPELTRFVERLDVLLEKGDNRPVWEGELSMFKAFLCYWQGQAVDMLNHITFAQKNLPATHDLMRADSEIYFGLAHHMAGQKNVAIDALNQRISQQPERKGLLVSRQVITLTFVHLLSGNLKEAALYSRQLSELARTVSPVYITSWSQFLSGCCHFQSGDWQAAEHCFRWLVENKYIAHTAVAMSSMIGLSLSLLFMGRSGESDQIVQDLLDFAVETKDPDNLVLAHSAQARIGLLRGDSENILPKSIAASMATAFIFLEAVPITQCRLRMEGEGGAQTIAMIERVQKETEAFHNTYHLIDLMALKAIAYYRDDRLDDAEKCMEQVIDLAAPLGWVRPFIELGPPMAALLTRMKQQYPALDYIDTLLNAFRDLPVNSQSQVQQAKSNPDILLIDPLTNRELDVLELLAERLRDKEIADKLCVTIATVKTHLRHIYEKLAVDGRRQAVQRARQSGLLNK